MRGEQLAYRTPPPRLGIRGHQRHSYVIGGNQRTAPLRLGLESEVISGTHMSSEAISVPHSSASAWNRCPRSPLAERSLRRPLSAMSSVGITYAMSELEPSPSPLTPPLT